MIQKAQNKKSWRRKFKEIKKNFIELTFGFSIFLGIVLAFGYFGNLWEKYSDKKEEIRILNDTPVYVKGKIIDYEKRIDGENSCIVEYILHGERYECKSRELYLQGWVIGEKVTLYLDHKNFDNFVIEECSLTM